MNILLEVAVALIVVFLLLSLATTAVTEAIASLLKTRAHHLSHALTHLLSDTKVRQAFDRHPLVATFRVPDEAAEGRPLIGPLRKRRRQPSYLSSASFAKALHKAILDAQGEDAAMPAQNAGFGFRETAAKIEDETLRSAVLTLIDSASGSLEETQQAFAAWFDTAMGQLSGQFKRRQQFVSFCVAFALAAVANFNVFLFADELIENDARRLAFVEFAEAQLESGEFDAFFAVSEDDQNNGTAQAPIDPFGALTEFGFSHTEFDLETFAAALKQPLNWLSWMVAGFASILGAPFWFDFLKRFVNIRGSGARPPSNSN